MCHIYYGKWEMTNNRQDRTAKPGKDQNAWKEGKQQELGNIGSGHHQTNRDERKKL